MTRPTPLLLIILDGFGVSIENSGNPVAFAKKPAFDALDQYFPFTTLQASGVAVGLPWGVPGNSEVGHLTMGAGRVLHHHLPRIIHAIHDGSFYQNPAFLQAIAHTKTNASKLHIAGLISSGSVHGYIDHFYALLELIKQQQAGPIYLHIFSDGKDALPREGARFLETFQYFLDKEYPGFVQIASLIGRFYAMDRDGKWERIQKCYELLTQGIGTLLDTSLPQYFSMLYSRGVTDEFIPPTLIADPKTHQAVATISANDALLFLNFREDSMRELTHAFVDAQFEHFPRKKIDNLFVATMTEYQKGLAAAPAFPTIETRLPLAEVLGAACLTHLHMAESQKYAHVTYFFNGGREDPFPYEERVLLSSLGVQRTEEAPQMRATELTAAILSHLQTHSVIIANYANADMIGHSGSFRGAIAAVETLDQMVKRLMDAILATDGVMLITSDHGNIELKRDPVSGEKVTKHSINPVPLYLVGKKFQRSAPRTPEEIIRKKSEATGILTDVAPTILELLGLPQPAEMTGKSLLPALLNAN